MATTNTKTREEWLNDAAAKLWPMLEAVGAKRAPVHVSVGFPSARALSAKNRRIGECWAAACSADGAAHIFIHPALIDVVEVLETLAHEMIHAATPGAGHGKGFAAVAKPFGMVGKMTSTKPSEELAKGLTALGWSLGPYPQPAFNPGANGRKKQSTRMLKIVCADCGYTVRTSAKWLEHGTPSCACGAGPMQAPDLGEERAPCCLEYGTGSGEHSDECETNSEEEI